MQLANRAVLALRELALETIYAPGVRACITRVKGPQIVRSAHLRGSLVRKALLLWTVTLGTTRLRVP